MPKQINGGINRKEVLPGKIEDSATIEAGIENTDSVSFGIEDSSINIFGLKGEKVETPEGMKDFHVTIIGDMGYVETRQK